MADGVVSTVTISAVTYSVYSFTSNGVTDGDQYFAARLGAGAWTAATTLQKQQALVTSQRELDRRLIWEGTKTVSSQALQFPRDDLFYLGTALADNLIPANIVYGEFERALELLGNPALQDVRSAGNNIESLQAGGSAGEVNISYFRPQTNTAVDTPFGQVVWDLVKYYVDGTDGSAAGGSSTELTLPVAEGTDEESTFADSNTTVAPFARSEAFL